MEDFLEGRVTEREEQLKKARTLGMILTLSKNLPQDIRQDLRMNTSHSQTYFNNLKERYNTAIKKYGISHADIASQNT